MREVLPYTDRPTRAACEELDSWRTRLDFKGPLPRAWQGRLRRDLEAEAVAASTIMAGVPVTVDEVRRILAGDRTTLTREGDRRLVEGYRDAMEFVLRRADDPSFAWSPELIIGLHDRVMGGRWTEGAGRFREGQRWVANSRTGQVLFLPPSRDEVPTLVDLACQRMEAMPAHPAVRAAWIHVAIGAIHPFSDGNGRTARVLASLAMYRGGFKRQEFTTLEEWWGRHLADYYAAFECLGREFDAATDVSPFVQVHVAAQLSQVRALDLRERVERRIWTALENLASDLRLDPRIANTLWDAFFGRDVTAGYYRSLADVSPATATQDLRSAVAARLLAPVGERRARRYAPGPRLFESVAGALELDLAGADPGKEIIMDVLTRRSTAGGGLS